MQPVVLCVCVHSGLVCMCACVRACVLTVCVCNVVMEQKQMFLPWIVGPFMDMSLVREIGKGNSNTQYIH